MAKKTHELALCGVLCALAVAFLWLSGVIPLSTYAWPILASATLLPAREECRKSYAWSCFAAAAVLGLLLCADKEAALVFCFLGYYPLVKPNLDAISSKALRLFAKLGLCTVSMGVMYALIIFVFKLPAVVQEFSESAAWLLWATAAMGLLENLQRENLNPFEQAQGLRDVMVLWDCTQAEAAKRLGMAQPTLANKLRLLQLTGDQRQFILDNGLTERHARGIT